MGAPNPSAGYVRAKRAERRKAGLCYECPKPAAKDRTRCEEHLARAVEAAREWRRRSES